MIGRAHLSEIEEHLEEHHTATLTAADEKEIRRIASEMDSAVDEENWEKCRDSLAKLKQILSRPLKEKNS